MTEFISEIIGLFKDESFRHWFFWTIVIVILIGGYPTAVKVYKKK